MTSTGRSHEYLTAGEVARLFHVSAKSVTRWAVEGRLPHWKTLGGHRRYPRLDIEELARSLEHEPENVA